MSVSEREVWTPEMDAALVDAFLHQQNEGNKVQGTFTTKAYNNITKELQEKLQRPFQKEKVKNRWKLVKRNFTKCYDIFKNLSGFAWDSNTSRWFAEPEVWQKLIEAKPEAREWMNKAIPNYDKLVITCGDDRATGGNVENGQDIRNKRPLTGDSESYGTNEVTGESLQETSNDQDVTSPVVQIVEEEPRAKKSRKSKEETEFEGLKAALMNIADAFRDSTAAYEKAHQKLPITEPEIWKLLEDLQIDRHLFNRAYLYLLDNPDRVRALLGCPKNMQKDLLMEMVFGPAGSSSLATLCYWIVVF